MSTVNQNRQKSLMVNCPIGEKPLQIILKRLFDMIFSLFGLIAFSPVFLCIGVLIKKEDGGSVFYRGERVGRYGKPFRIVKFRTMVRDADKLTRPPITNDNPYITKVGRVLRRYKLDELPQLINVLKGEMSLVGPRPEVQCYVDMFTEEEKAILRVRPGITDLASIWNPDQEGILVGSSDPRKTYLERIRPEKVRLQLKYVREQSLWTDMKILFKTLRPIFKQIRITK